MVNFLKDKSILVTGGAGFIGSHLVDRLLKEKPSKIVVVDNLFLGKLSNLEDAKSKYKNLTIYIRDASNLALLEEIVRKEEVEIVFDFATVPLLTSYVHPEWTYENNIKIVLNLCKLLKDGAFNYYIHCSSSEVYGSGIFFPMAEDHPLNPTTTYGASKASEDILIQSFDRMYDFNYFICRPFNTFGERQNDKAYAGVIPYTVKRILSGLPPIVHGDGLQTRDFIYVKDLVEIIVSMVNNSYTKINKKIINIARGKEIEIKNLIGKICNFMGYKGEIKKEINPRPNDVKRHFADNKVLNSIIKFKFTEFEDALEKVIEWYRRKMD